MPQISYIKYTDVLEVRRYDAEYFKPEYLELQKSINKYGANTILELKCELDCSAFYPSVTDDYDFNQNGIPFLRVNEIQNGIVRITENTAFLPESILKEYSSNIKLAYPGDIIIAKGGNSLAKVGLLTDTYNYYSVCRDLIIIRTNKIVNIDKYFLWLFLHSKIGQKIMLRTASQTGQPHLTINEIKNITVPKNTKGENICKNAFLKSIELEIKSKQLYREAEQLLLAELGLLDYQVKNTLSFSTTKKEIEEAHRYDSEYFQPKYAEIVKKIEEYKGGWDLVKNVINLKDKNYTPKIDQKYKYLALSNISSQGYIQDYQEEFGKDLPSRARRKINTNDLIISSIEGSLSSCALVEKKFDNSICSTGFFVLNSEKINSETLLILFKSSIVQEFLQRGSKGTILTAISKTELESIKIPLIESSIQEQIAEKIQDSHKLRKEGRELLEEAKRKVEEEIEK